MYSRVSPVPNALLISDARRGRCPPPSLGAVLELPPAGARAAHSRSRRLGRVVPEPTDSTAPCWGSPHDRPAVRPRRRARTDHPHDLPTTREPDQKRHAVAQAPYGPLQRCVETRAPDDPGSHAGAAPHPFSTTRKGVPREPHPTDDCRLLAAGDRLEAAVRRTGEEAPPLTDEQRAALRALPSRIEGVIAMTYRTRTRPAVTIREGAEKCEKQQEADRARKARRRARRAAGSDGAARPL
jgi:hypothetical protein